MPNALPGLAITDESDAELMAVVIALISKGKRKKIARNLRKLRGQLAERATPPGVVWLRGEERRKWQRERAAEALARMDRITEILRAAP